MVKTVFELGGWLTYGGGLQNADFAHIYALYFWTVAPSKDVRLIAGTLVGQLALRFSLIVSRQGNGE
jgi:hypothetical protein